jgi:hypothetical protein
MQNLRKLPFTALLLMTVISTAIISESHSSSLGSPWRREFGFAAWHLVRGDVHRIFTSLFLTAGGWHFYASLLMIGAGVGTAEWIYGTRRTVATFFGIHVVTLFAFAVCFALPLYWMGVRHGELLIHVRDVGPSSGYYGCLGLAMTSYPKRLRRFLVPGVLLVLLARLGWSATMLPAPGFLLAADLAHVMALCLGLVAATVTAATGDRPVHLAGGNISNADSHKRPTTLH